MEEVSCNDDGGGEPGTSWLGSETAADGAATPLRLRFALDLAVFVVDVLAYRTKAVRTLFRDMLDLKSIGITCDEEEPGYFYLLIIFNPSTLLMQKSF